MTELQTKILSLLKEIDDICRENDIEYYLEGGAVLGAIRHGGFLPWDDDSDLAMTRSNWNKFCEVIFRDKPKDRAIESPELNDMYPTNTFRYIDTTTTDIWRSMMYDISACGVFVDIFVLEDAPDDDEQLEQMKRDFIDYSEIINPFYRLSSLGDSERYRRHLKRSKRIGRRNVAKELNDQVLKYHGQPCSRYLLRWGLRFQVYDKAVYGKPTYVPFENLMLPIPERPIEYLVYQYGFDWFMIPESDEVELHDTVLDLEIGYRDYMDAYMPLIDKKKAIALHTKYKDLEMEILDHNKAYYKYIYGQAGAMTVQMMNKKIRESGINLSTAFDKVTPESKALFEEIFGDYLCKQLNTWFLFYDVVVPMEDDMLSCIISYLLRTNRCRQAEKLLLFRLEQKRPLSDALSSTVDSYHALVKAMNLFWSGYYSKAAQYIRQNELLIEIPVAKAICMYDEVLACEGEELPNKKQILEESISLWNNEDLFKLAYVLVLLKLGDCRSAHMTAAQLQEESHNGMVRRILQIDPAFEILRDYETV